MTKPTSHTELSTLAACEMRWFLRYVERGPRDESGPLYLGRLMHESLEDLWNGKAWYERWTTDMRPELAATAIEPYITAAWLLERYVEHHAKLLDESAVIATEQRLFVPVPKGPKGALHECVLDGVIEHGGRRWAVEHKTYGRNQRLDLLMVDPQLTLNLAVAREHYENVAGILFDGIYTYRWKRDAHPPSDSFHLDWLDRTPEHTAAAWAEVRSGISRRVALKRTKHPMRNIGQMCSSCAQRGTCFERLAFPLDIDLDLDIDAA